MFDFIKNSTSASSAPVDGPESKERIQPLRAEDASHGPPEVIAEQHLGNGVDGVVFERTIEQIEETKKGWGAYLRTLDFYIVLFMG